MSTRPGANIDSFPLSLHFHFLNFLKMPDKVSLSVKFEKMADLQGMYLCFSLSTQAFVCKTYQSPLERFVPMSQSSLEKVHAVLMLKQILIGNLLSIFSCLMYRKQTNAACPTKRQQLLKWICYMYLITMLKSNQSGTKLQLIGSFCHFR